MLARRIEQEQMQQQREQEARLAKLRQLNADREKEKLRITQEYLSAKQRVKEQIDKQSVSRERRRKEAKSWMALRQKE